MALVALTVGVLAALTGAAGIYPDDHWSKSFKMTNADSFQQKVKQEVDAGKTLFVRFIASEG